jgi:hypothetical protein
MKKAGGIIAIIAGIFGVIAAVATLLIGGMGSALGGDGATAVIGLGWGGIIFSFIVIVMGAICIGTRGKAPSIILIIASVCGIVLGGTFVAVFMVLSLIAGVLVLLGVSREAE